MGGEGIILLSPGRDQRPPGIEWRAMTGMRDRLIHDCFGIDYEIVWDVVRNRIPELRRQVSSLLGHNTRLLRTVLASEGSSFRFAASGADLIRSRIAKR